MKRQTAKQVAVLTAKNASARKSLGLTLTRREEAILTLYGERREGVQK